MKKAPFRIDSGALRLRHVIEEQRLEVGAPSQAAAYALLERLGGLNQRRLLPTIERVFDEFDSPAQVIRIERIDLDLGRFGAGELDKMEVRLAETLRAALRRALQRGGGVSATLEAAPAAAVELTAFLPVEGTLLDALEHYLLHGTWPYGGSLDLSSAPADVLGSLIDTSGQAVVRMLRRHAGSERLLRRLVWQMPEALLARLLAVLEPAQAKWILVYIAEARAAHERQAVIDEPPPAFSRRIWTIVLRDALHQAGLHANRRAFLRNLIERMAEGAGEAYADLLDELRRGLEAMPQAARRPGSLLRTLDELAQVDVSGREPAGEGFAAFAAILEGRAVRGGWLGSDGILRPLEEARALTAHGFSAFANEADWLLRRLSSSGSADAEAWLRPLLAAETATREAPLPWPLLGEGAGPGTHGGERVRLRTRADEALASVGQAPAMLRLQRLLSGAADEAAVTAAAAIEAVAQDPVGTKRLLRRLARADPAAFARRIEGDAAAAVGLLLGAGAAQPVHRLLHMLAPSAAETLRLLRLFAELPAAATAEAAFVQVLESVAKARGSEPAGLASELLLAKGVRAPEGAEERRVARLLIAAASPDATRPWPEMERWRVLGLLRAALLSGSPLPREAGAALSRLSALPPALLIRSLEGRFRADRIASALRELRDDRLLRLALLLGRGLEGARERLRGANGRTEILRIVTELLLGARIQLSTTEQHRKQATPLDRFASLGIAERDLVLDLARLLTEGSGVGLAPPDAVRRSLAAAAARRLTLGSGPSLAALWREELSRILPPRGQRALRQAMEKRWPGDKGGTEALRALGLTTSEARGPRSAGTAAAAAHPERGSLAWVLALLEEGTAEARRLLRAALRSAQLRERLCRALPERLLLRLVRAQAPREAAALLGSAETMAAAIARCGGRLVREEMWAALLEAGVSPDPVASLAGRLVEDAARSEGGRAKGAKDLVGRIETEAAAIACSRGLGALKAALEERAYERAPLRPRPRREEDLPPERKLWDPLPVEEGRRAALANAGLVLVGPYLPQFFKHLGLVGEDGKFLGGEAPSRGVHLLQYLVDRRCDAPEPDLALNKLLCGLDPSQPVLASIEAGEAELDTCASLLEAMISRWPQLRGSSPEALRETFLQREGCLVRGPDGWRVEVERKILDVLMEDLPWSFSMIFHPWMPELISVTW